MLRWILRAVVSVSVVAVLVSVASTEGLREAFSRVRGSVWVASLLVFLAGHALNAAKFRWLLQAPRPRLSVCLRAHFAGLVANLGLPGVAGGDVVRATYLLPHGVSAVSATAAGILDRVIDTATLALLIGAGALVAGVPPSLTDRVTVRWPVAIAAVVAAGAAGLGLRWWIRQRRRLSGAAGFAIDLGALAPAAAAAAIVTAGVQSAFVLVNVWMARDLGLEIGTAPWFVAWPLSKIIAILPISLGGIGVREAALVSLLAPYGAPSALVFVSGLLWQGVLMTSGLLGLAIGSVLGTANAVPSSSAQRS
jgi:glycosyltransferase 2 family protein